MTSSPLVLAGLLLCSTQASAMLFTFEQSVGAVIPDGEPTGLVSYLEVNGSGPEIAKVTVTLELAGGFSGDLYAHLSHESGFATLLNRVGRTAEEPWGYLDSGMSVTFDDEAIQGDIHRYRETLGGSPLSGPLTGVWQPDGRTTLPTLTVTSDPRDSALASFKGLDPNGTWNLVIADFDGGGEATLVKWGLTITAVPEPPSLALAAAGGLLLWILLGRRHRQSRDLGIQPRNR